MSIRTMTGLVRNKRASGRNKVLTDAEALEERDGSKKSIRTVRTRRVALAGAALAIVLLWMPMPGGSRMPPGTRQYGAARALTIEDTQALFDLSGVAEQTGERVLEQEIFDELLRGIASAQDFVAVDFFLWNDWAGSGAKPHRLLACELADALIARKEASPDLLVFAVTDPFNRLYGGHAPACHARMAEAGVRLVYTDLFRLPESNILYGRPARRLARLLARAPGLDRPLLRNPFEAEGRALSARETARLLHFKANHRKVMIADDGAKLRLWTTSLNPAGGSAAHANIAISVTGAAALDALESLRSVWTWSAEGAYATFSEADRQEAEREWERVMQSARRLAGDARPPGERYPQVRWLTEGAIRDEILRQLAACGADDDVAVALFYLSDRGTIQALIEAARNGARVRVILDVNRDAFGREKTGIPNRPVAAELMAASRENTGRLHVRWAETRGEQFHLKSMGIRSAERHVLLAGSANWTRRNLADFNLEANLLLENAREPVEAYFAVFERLWTNEDRLHTAPYEDYADEEGWTLRTKTVLGRILEATGAGSH